MLDHELSEAIALLKEESLDLDGAFELIRPALAGLLLKIQQTPSHQFDDEVETMVSVLLDKKGDQHIADPLEKWVYDAARELGIVTHVASRSKTAADALKKLFRAL